MEQAMPQQPQPPNAPPRYGCPNCGAGLYSPYHTLCPVCAEPIDAELLHRVLGRSVETTGGGSR
jgi:predicted amidophosphoribosyltransferase